MASNRIGPQKTFNTQNLPRPGDSHAAQKVNQGSFR